MALHIKLPVDEWVVDDIILIFSFFFRFSLDMVDVIFSREFLEVEIVFLYFGENGFGDICDLLLIHVRCASEKRERFTYGV